MSHQLEDKEPSISGKMEDDNIFDKIAFDKLIDNEIKIASKEINKMGKNLKRVMKIKSRAPSSATGSLKKLKIFMSDKRLMAKARLVMGLKN